MSSTECTDFTTTLGASQVYPLSVSASRLDVAICSKLTQFFARFPLPLFMILATLDEVRVVPGGSLARDANRIIKPLRVVPVDLVSLMSLRREISSLRHLT
jgi:hypothetical protein